MVSRSYGGTVVGRRTYTAARSTSRRSFKLVKRVRGIVCVMQSLTLEAEAKKSMREGWNGQRAVEYLARPVDSSHGRVRAHSERDGRGVWRGQCSYIYGGRPWRFGLAVGGSPGSSDTEEGKHARAQSFRVAADL